MDDVAWYTDNADETHAVATKLPNGCGLYDMSGNVYEWVGDWYNYSYDAFGVVDPDGPVSGSYRVIRGGGWHYYAQSTRVSYRDYGDPTAASDNVGFRLVRTIP